MPNINEFIGPKPEQIHRAELEKIVGKKPCAKCDKDVDEAFWDPMQLVMSWTCPDGHHNTVKVG